MTTFEVEQRIPPVSFFLADIADVGTGVWRSAAMGFFLQQPAGIDQLGEAGVYLGRQDSGGVVEKQLVQLRIQLGALLGSALLQFDQVARVFGRL